MIILETLFPGPGAGGILGPTVKERKSHFMTFDFAIFVIIVFYFHDKTVSLGQHRLPQDMWESQTENRACFELDSADFHNFIHNG